MKKIYKYKLLTTSTTLDLPLNGNVIKVDVQNDEVCIWVLFHEEDEKNTEPRKFQIVGTGEPFDAEHRLMYLDSVQQGPFVWHIFEEYDQ